MTDKKEIQAKNKYTPDWFVQGVLTKIGETFDKFTGRNWKPSSSLATSELTERLKNLLDAEARQDGKAIFVPHNIKLKTQWDKFSTDSEKGMKKLENELLTSAVDHINDKRYHTYAPLKVEVKPDYFTEGVKLMASFEEFAPEPNTPEAEVDVTIPQIKVGEFIPPAAQEEIKEPAGENYVAEFVFNGKQVSKELEFTNGKRLSVGRTKENDLSLDDESVSKNHATLMVNREGKFLVADTGSTNGTFINNERIAYGRAFAVGEGDKLKFGNIEVFFRKVPEIAPFVSQSDVKTEMFESKNIFSEELPENEFKKTSSEKTPFQTVEERQNNITSRGISENFQNENVVKENADFPVTQPSLNIDLENGEKS